MSKFRVSFDLSLKGNLSSCSSIICWVSDAIQFNLNPGESITNLIVEESDESNEEMDSTELEEQQRMMRKFSPPSDEDGC